MKPLNIKYGRESIVPKDILDTNLFHYLDTLLKGLGNDHVISNIGEMKAKNLEIAVTEFLDLVMFTESLEHKHYLKTRLLRMKSVEKVLWQIEKYAPIIFDKSEDLEYGLPEGFNPLKTRYSPRLLKVVIQSLTINNLAQNFVEIIDTMFANLLYFLEYELDIRELIYKLTVDIKKTVVGYRSANLKLINLDTDFNE